MAAPYTGQIIGFSKVATSTPAAFCAAVFGGSLEIDPHNSEAKGIGDQMLAGKGTTEVSITGLECEGVDADDLALWCPTTAGAQVAAMPDFLVTCTGGYQWILTLCQPGAFGMKLDAGPDARVKFTFSLKGIATPAAASLTPVYVSLLGFSRPQVQAQYNGSDFDVLSVDISNDMGVAMFDPLNARTANTMTNPVGYYVSGQSPRCSVVMASEGAGAAALFADADAPADLTLLCDNGTDDALLVTLTDMIPGAWKMAMTPDGITGFDQAFQPGPGTVSNRIQFSNPDDES